MSDLKDTTATDSFGPDIKVVYQHFTPTQKQRWAIDNSLTNLLEQCPSKALIVATCSAPGPNAFRLELVVQSFEDSFHSTREDTVFESCLENCTKAILSQLIPWKKRRFHKEEESFSYKDHL